MTASIGIAECKFISKIASDLCKPDGLSIVPPGQAKEFLAPLPVSRLPGVGEKTCQTLKKMGIRTIKELSGAPQAGLVSKLGEVTARYLKALADGSGNAEVEPVREEKSFSRERTFQKDTADRALLRRVLLSLTDDVSRRLRSHGIKGRTILLNFRTKDFSRHTRHKTLPGPTDLSNEIFGEVEALFNREVPPGTLIRLIGMGVTNFKGEESAAQLDMFTRGPDNDGRQRKKDAVLDSILAKFGDGSIKRASLVRPPKKRVI
jgi:DNA polymerase-4